MRLFSAGKIGVTVLAGITILVMSIRDCTAQQTGTIDSLKLILAGDFPDTSKISALGELGMQHYLYDLPLALDFWNRQLELANRCLKEKGRPDREFLFQAKANAYGSIAYVYQTWGNLDTAVILSDSCLTIFKKTGDAKGEASLLNNLGVIHNYRGQIADALACYRKSYRLLDSVGYGEGAAMALNNIALIYYNQGDIPMALEYHHKGLKISEEIGDPYTLGHAYNNLGIIYRQQGDFAKGMEYFQKSYDVRKKISDYNGMALALNEIGVSWYDQNDYDKAIEYHRQSLDLRVKLGDSTYIAQSLINIGMSLVKNNRLKEALDYFFHALDIKQKTDEVQGIADAYDHISATYFLLKDYNRAEDYSLKALKIARDLDYPSDIKNSSRHLSEIYAAQGKFREAYEMHYLFKQMSDSMFNEKTRKATFKQQLRYQFEKKAMADSLQHAGELLKKDLELEKKEKETLKQRIIIYSFIIGFTILVVFSFLLLRLFLQKKRANRLLAEQNDKILQKNEEVSAQKEEIESQRDEITAQRDLVVEQKQVVEQQNLEITSSITYALRIQTALLPTDEYLDEILGEHFIFFRPKDVVSGDFYWATTVATTNSRYAQPCVSTILVVAVADCTGHGVPGAFMSMLGISFLNEIVRKDEITDAAQILSRLRESVIENLRQKGAEFISMKDGMDISLAVLNREKNHGQWAGANNPLWLIKNTDIVETNGRSSLHNGNLTINTDYSPRHLIEIKPDKMPVAIHPNMSSFTNHELTLQPGDRLYMCTDGFADQFGGNEGKKFKYGQFRKLLLESSRISMQDQGKKMESELDKWM
ncbi:MAG: tetratricopeptide repeat protein, partial [Bacteroidetes bacterium]|nr:tetratricopeptide repeat protein [Bacteroidota bacterium]